MSMKKKSGVSLLYFISQLYARNISFEHSRNNQYATVRMYGIRLHETTIDSRGRCATTPSALLILSKVQMKTICRETAKNNSRGE